MRLSTFKAAVASTSKTLGCTAVCFDFRHLFAPIIKVKSLSVTQQGKMHGPEELTASFQMILNSSSLGCLM
jgi:hypothetical protein